VMRRFRRWDKSYEKKGDYRAIKVNAGRWSALGSSEPIRAGGVISRARNRAFSWNPVVGVHSVSSPAVRFEN
jgi:hypothetical protein